MDVAINAQPSYKGNMTVVARILAIVLLAAFAAGATAHATNSTAMSAQMTLAGESATDMADCANCERDGNGEASGIACDLVCSVPFVATLHVERELPQPAPMILSAFAASDRTGLSRRPDTHPPRSTSVS